MKKKDNRICRRCGVLAWEVKAFNLVCNQEGEYYKRHFYSRINYMEKKLLNILNAWVNDDDRQYLINELEPFIQSLLEEEQKRIYAFTEERLLGVDDDLLKELSNIIFNRSHCL